MLRRILVLVALGAILLPDVNRAHGREWEEDYSDDEGSYAPDDYDVSVDLNVSGSVNFDTFQGALSPYGEWVVAGSYGRVWRPRVAAQWRPYYYGRWEWTNEGWLWVSDEPWGWAAYHYGRWTYDNSYGWVWIPGYQWAPAWVAWRYSGDVVGWAPLGPGISVYVSSYPFVSAWWTFVPCSRFVAVPVSTIAYAPAYTRRHFYATAPAPPRAGPRPVPGRAVPAPAWGGPPRRAIEQRIGRPVAPVRVVAAPSPGAARVVRPGEVAVFRPEARPAPVGRERGPARAPGARGFGEPPQRSVRPFESPGRGAAGTMPSPRAEREGRIPPGEVNTRGPAVAPRTLDRGERGNPVIRGERPDGGSVQAPQPRAATREAPAVRGGGRPPGAVAPAPSAPAGGRNPAAAQPRGPRPAPAPRGERR